jgi:hypothetical protein
VRFIEKDLFDRRAAKHEIIADRPRSRHFRGSPVPCDACG